MYVISSFSFPWLCLTKCQHSNCRDSKCVFCFYLVYPCLYFISQFATGLTAVAKSLRNCAEFADTFAKIVADTPYSPETAVVLQGMSPIRLFTRVITKILGASESGKGKRKAAHSPEDGEAPKRRKRNMKPKDPNAPKRPASSYILFQNDVRKELKGQHPNLSNSDLMGLISEQWKNLSHEQKEVKRVLKAITSCLPFLTTDLQPADANCESSIYRGKESLR